MRARTSRRRSRADWVYRAVLVDGTGALIDSNATYYPDGFLSVPPGIANSVGLILYDSFNRTKQLTNLGATPIVMGRYFRAEGRNPRIHRVQGDFFVTPSTWALGSIFAIGMRIAVLRQSAATGAILLPTAYNMWGGGTNLPDTLAAHFANIPHVADFHRIVAFNDNSNVTRIPINVPVRRSLKADECLALYVEGRVGSVTMNVTPTLRSLVSDDS